MYYHDAIDSAKQWAIVLQRPRLGKLDHVDCTSDMCFLS